MLLQNGFESLMPFNQAKQWTPQPVTLFVPKSPPSCSALVSGVGMTPHVKLNVQMPADYSARVSFFFN